MHLAAFGFDISIASEAATETRYPEAVFRPLVASEDMPPYRGLAVRQRQLCPAAFLSLAWSLASGRPVPEVPKWISGHCAIWRRRGRLR